ncbi:MAG: four helix bundle protein [Nitrospirae bacterium CG_4_10_14_0_8_um_filter_41_23]|nr:MAG: four helix bundle protein [Nitrospirae bacterium CG11_big_fil_rev_8_21_14_0_20_41_14]PIV43801.1 MAG: four helix bundle protein [Nitrospirae bacterium CG02_land_8_20_14_3_00_41_53]PIW87133.1 MAG: four helix bundle protein [Nitrospirae bacterium CG_4_8_14_3_um_filter_41_47]PIY87624.1 MAG: four helix bundle protein [Nitrospirae bacterium CG_4_10_14_0_8_um_filter_41_23]PJA79772.1 MAG: four helix bundle protein [Nitrospirae bacterium CG_4_9_14_3_um_filter_41_27]
MKIEKFEDIDSWKEARALVKEIYSHFSPVKDYGFRDQIQRAALSIMSNLAEGFERGSRSEFHQFIVIAKGSCAEVRSQLYIALDVGYITQEQFDHVSTLAIEVSRIIGGLRSSVQKQRTKK